MRMLVLALATMPLAGCSLFHEPAPPPEIVFKNTTTTPPDECESPDPEWHDPPQGFEPLPDIARRERANKDGFNAMRSNRAVCRAGLKASDNPQSTFRG